MEGTRHKKTVAAHFDRSAELWDLLYEDSPHCIGINYRIFMRQRLELVLNAIDVHSGGRKLHVLDIGCGAGKLILGLARRGHSTVGVDLSETMLKRASRAVEEAGVGSARCACADAELLPFNRDCFDAVCCVGLLEYLEQDEQILAEVNRVLRRGGVLVVTAPNLLKLQYLLDPYYYFVRGVAYLRHRFGFKAANRPAGDENAVGKNTTFAARRFLRGHLDKAVGIGGYRRVGCEPVGFGPFTCWRRDCFSEETSLRWSGALDELSRRRGMHWLSHFANRWVFSYVKEGPCDQL